MYDFETNGKDPNICSAVQLAAVVLDPRTLELIPGAEFNAFMRPDFATNEQGAIEFHAKLKKTTDAEILAAWETYPEPSVVWPEFVSFMKKYHTRQDRQSGHTAPIAAGMNILAFDMPIINRYHALYGNGKDLFNGRDKIDLLHWFFPWFENNQDIKGYSLDAIREYFGMETEGAHDALKDVKDCAEIIVRFMKQYRRVAPKIKFKNSFKKIENDADTPV